VQRAHPADLLGSVGLGASRSASPLSARGFAGRLGGGPCRGSGRVGGKPCQHRSDRLGLLLRKAAASLAAQQVHLVGEPWRPRSWPSALAGGGPACRWPGPRIAIGHARLLTRPPTAAGPLAEIHGWRRWEYRTRSRSCLDHADGASTRAPTPTSVQHRRRSNAGLQTVVDRIAVLIHDSFTSRSGTQRIRNLTRTFGLAGSRYGHGQSARVVQVAGRTPVPSVGPVSRIRTCEPGQERQGQNPAAAPLRPHARPLSRPSVRSVGPPSQGRSPSRANSPISHLRPTRSSARIRLTDHPCSRCRACR
jgi:hypothetical protein